MFCQVGGFDIRVLDLISNQTWKVFCQMSHLMARLCVRFMSNWHWGYVSQLSNATFDSCKLLPSFIPDWHTLCVRSDWQSLTFVFLRSICKYQHSSFARNIDLLEMLTYSSLANPGSLMTASLSCHQHGHATIAPTQSRPWHQRHLSTGNCRHQSAEAWSLYVLSACLDLRWFKQSQKPSSAETCGSGEERIVAAWNCPQTTSLLSLSLLRLCGFKKWYCIYICLTLCLFRPVLHLTLLFKFTTLQRRRCCPRMIESLKELGAIWGAWTSSLSGNYGLAVKVVTSRVRNMYLELVAVLINCISIIQVSFILVYVHTN